MQKIEHAETYISELEMLNQAVMRHDILTNAVLKLRNRLLEAEEISRTLKMQIDKYKGE